MKRTTIETKVVRYPTTRQVMQVKCMSDGNFDIVIKNPYEGRKSMWWSVAGMFTGGKTGTRMRLIEIESGS